MKCHKKMIGVSRQLKYRAVMDTFCALFGIKTTGIKGNLWDNLSVVFQITSKEPGCMMYASERVRAFLLHGTLDNSFLAEKIDIKWIAVRLVMRNGMALQYISNGLRNDLDVVGPAMAQNPKSFKYASDTLRNKWAVAYEAVKGDGMNLEHVGKDQKKDAWIILAALKKNPESKVHIPIEMQKNADIRKAISVANGA